MSLKHIFVQTCQLIVLLNFTYTYVLLAANLDDFRSIAKKFIPGKLADQLAEIAAQNSAKYKQLIKNKHVETMKVGIEKETDEYTDEKDNIDVTTHKGIRELKTTPKKRFAIKNKHINVNFDELVDKVREQLESKFKANLKTEHIKDNNDDYYSESGDDETRKVDKIEATQKTAKYKIKRTPKLKHITKTTTENAQMYYDEGPEVKPLVENEGMYFKEDDLTKAKDSYEDYVMPEKDDVFESDSEKTTKSQRVPSEEKSRYKTQRLKSVAKEKTEEPLTEEVTEGDRIVKEGDKIIEEGDKVLEEQDYSSHKSEEVKAKTESLLDEPDQKDVKPKKLKGTMIPTRQYYKMSSPNYYAKLPVVAEKYDFNEPIPERDREPEDLKYFPNPSASINKKVKLTSM